MLEGARLKLERANLHIVDLESAFQAFIETRPQRLSYSSKREGEKQSLSMEIILDEPIPTNIGLIIGDAVHNLRTALDHATWELIGLDGGTQNNNLQFPTAKNRGKYNALCKKIITPRQDTNDFFTNLEAYESGAGDILYRLGRLDNADKHRIVTPSCMAQILATSAQFPPKATR